jgi:ubiquinone/menaquinone biosynthesis C-methylase UbiE
MRYFIKKLLTQFVDFLALLQGFSFPQKYTWRWKLTMLTNRYEPETTRVLRDLLAPSMIVLDVGAHIGYFTRLASKQVGPEGHVRI